MAIEFLALTTIRTLDWESPLFGYSSVQQNVTRFTGDFRA